MPPQSFGVNYHRLRLTIYIYYFLRIKKKLFTTFHPQTDGQTERQNCIIKVYFRVFVNWEQNNWAKLLPITEFVYNNTKSTSTGHTLFKLNYVYHPRVLFEEDINFYLRFRSANKLAEELRELIKVYYQNLLHI